MADDELADEIRRMVMDWVSSALEGTGVEMAANIYQSISEICPPHSAPGSPPHVETGTLITSVGYDVQPASETEMVLSVGAGPAIAEDGFDYSAHLETNMDRPYVLVRAEETAQMFVDKFLAQ